MTATRVAEKDAVRNRRVRRIGTMHADADCRVNCRLNREQITRHCQYICGVHTCHAHHNPAAY
jgi:hypothetical protein